ncbi:group III truncated hemoglobin [Azospirillum sp. sgz302134]
MHQPASTPTGSPITDRDIATLVRRFYDKALRDPVIGHTFTGVTDWEEHFEVIERFWASHLLGAKSYKGHPFMAHVDLDLTPESFTRWLALFQETATEVLPAPYAEQAVAKANHMAKSLTAGLFAVPGRKYQTPNVG